MGFKDVKIKTIDYLKRGLIAHEERGDIDIKNLLSTGAVSLDQVINIIRAAQGNKYSHGPHHLDATIDVHIVKTVYASQAWYIKWYFIEPDCIFKSVHC